MTIEPSDRVTVGRVCWTLNLPSREVLPLLRAAGAPVELDEQTGQAVTSRAALAALFRTLAGAA